MFIFNLKAKFLKKKKKKTKLNKAKKKKKNFRITKKWRIP